MSSKVASAGWLRGTLPRAPQTLLLRACLHPGSSAQRALDAWRARVGEPTQMLRGSGQDVHKALLPLLASRFEDEGLQGPQELRSLLRTALLREKLRLERLAEVARSVFDALGAAGIDYVLVDGLALAETVYPAPAARHSAGIRLLLAPESRARLPEALGRAELLHEPSGGPLGLSLWRHPSRVAVLPSSRLVEPGGYGPGFAEVFPRSQRRRIAGTELRILEPADALLSACSRGCWEGRARSLRWACDAWLLLQRYAPFPWQDLLDRALAGRLALRIVPALTYLAEELGASVPETTLRELRQAAQHAARPEREAALLTARQGTPGGLAGVLREARNLAERAEVLRLALLPGREFLDESYGCADLRGQLAYHAEALASAPVRLARAARAMRRRARSAEPDDPT